MPLGITNYLAKSLMKQYGVQNKLNKINDNME